MKRATCFSLVALVASLASAPAYAQTVQFDLAKTEALEVITPGLVWVRLSAAQSEEVTVPYTVVGGTATRGSTFDPPTDYVLSNGQVTFEPGEVIKAIQITIVDDSTVEQTEDVLLVLGPPSRGQLGSRAVHAYVIYDDDLVDDENQPPSQQDPPAPPPPPPPPPPPAGPRSLPEIGFASTTSSVNEGTGTGIVRVVLSAASTETVTVNYRVTGGTAVRPDDYTLADGSLSFPPGTTVQNISVALVNDTRAELDETVELALDDPVQATLAAAAHTLQIVDNDTVTVQFAAVASSGDEGTSPARIGIELSEESDREVSVGLVAGGTASGDGVDFTLPGALVTFAPRETSKFVSLPVSDDRLVEGDETIQLTLTSVTNAVLGGAIRHTYTITDNDRVLPTVQFGLRSSMSGEAIPAATVDVVLDPPSSETVRVSFAHVDGTAGTQDYQVTDGTLTFAPGETRKTIAVAVLEDVDEEADETFGLTLSNAENATIGPLGHHTFWILDDDAPGEEIVFFRQDVPSEDGGRKLVIVGPKTQTVAVGGMALDAVGNMYVSDQGNGPNNGSILMMPRGRRNVIRIMSGLNVPGDVELSPDGRALIVGNADGTVTKRAFGVSVKLINAGSIGAATRVYANTDRGPTPSVGISPDGYFHLPGILVDGQASDTITIVIEHNGLTRTHAHVPLGAAAPPPPDGSESSINRPVFGQTVIQLEAPVRQ